MKGEGHTGPSYRRRVGSLQGLLCRLALSGCVAKGAVPPCRRERGPSVSRPRLRLPLGTPVISASWWRPLPLPRRRPRRRLVQPGDHPPTWHALSKSCWPCELHSEAPIPRPTALSAAKGSLRMRAVSFAILIAALVLVVAIWGVKPNAVTGSITFGGDREIPAGAVLTVQLRDVS